LRLEPGASQKKKRDVLSQSGSKGRAPRRENGGGGRDPPSGNSRDSHLDLSMSEPRQKREESRKLIEREKKGGGGK